MFSLRIAKQPPLENRFPQEGTLEEKLRFCLNYAILAPSGHNTQPWLFKIKSDRLRVYADRTRGLPVVDPEDRALTISCGAALFHLRVAINYFGYAAEVETFPETGNSDLLAIIHLGDLTEPTSEMSSLFHAIPQRRTNRKPFENRAIPVPAQLMLKEAAESEGSSLNIVNGEDTKNHIAELVAAGDRIQAADTHFRRELAAWLHANRSRSRDGIPGYSFGFGDMISYAGPLMIRTFDWGKGQAAKDRQLAQGSPALAVLETDADTPMAWLSAGQALARVLLTATTERISASFLNQPIEVNELRPSLGELISSKGFPQVLLRFGYGPGVLPTPRRRVEDVEIVEN